MNIESLIDKVLRNKATKEEIAIVEKWKAETQANLDAIKKVHAILADSSDIKAYVDFDKKKAWNTITDEIQFEEVNPGKTKKIYWLSTAATLMLLFSVYYFLTAETTQRIYTDSSMKKIELEDGSMVWLNFESSIEISENFVNDRNVDLNGEAFFDVSHDEMRPFSINVGNVKVDVLGTSFNIKKIGPVTQIYVFEGLVRVASPQRSVTLTQGQMLSINDNDLRLHEKGNQGLDQWRNGKLVYKDFPLEMALKEIEAIKGYQFEHTGVDIKDCLLNTSFLESENIAQILHEFYLIFHMEYHLNKQSVDILSVNCN